VSSEQTAHATSGADGRAYLMGVPVGKYIVHVEGACTSRIELGMAGPHDDDAVAIVP
jgi:hypothetical protein